MDGKVIELEAASKRYGHVRALDGVTWSVRAGELLGFLGPNGAGKTTAIRILLGFLRPSSGTARVHGLDAWRSSTEIRRRVGYLPGDVRLYTGLTGAETIRFVAGARGRGGGADADRLAKAFELDLRPRVRTYSTGMRQKLGLILAMMHRPELLILDEPSSGLDPLMQQVLRRELRDVVADGRTVLFSSHSLPEAEQLCERVSILRQGRLVASESIAALRRAAGHRVTAKFERPVAELPPVPEGLRVDGHTEGGLHGRWLGDVRELMRWLTALPLKDVTIQPPDLEDLFIDYYALPGRTDR
ncbi:MAG: ABC transporter ATP-binding protein [Phycisphaerae bacterium]|nr:ABC transporter ATP-binding protein [Phycisphaerae bacterium]